MATKMMTVVGEANWPKLFEQVKDTKFDPDGAYVLSLTVSDETADDWDALKTMTKSKFDRTSKTNTITFRRKHKNKNEWAAGAPKVYNTDGSLRTFEDGIIWNGSKVEATVSVYDMMSGKAARLESVKILELAEAPEPEDEAGGKTPEPKARSTKDLDDEIPF